MVCSSAGPRVEMPEDGINSSTNNLLLTRLPSQSLIIRSAGSIPRAQLPLVEQMALPGVRHCPICRKLGFSLSDSNVTHSTGGRPANCFSAADGGAAAAASSSTSAEVAPARFMVGMYWVERICMYVCVGEVLLSRIELFFIQTTRFTMHVASSLFFVACPIAMCGAIGVSKF